MKQSSDDADSDDYQHDYPEDSDGRQPAALDVQNRQQPEPEHEQQSGGVHERAHQYTGIRGGICLRLLASSLTVNRPNAKPPMCAKYATPPPPPVGVVRFAAPNTACSANQMPSITQAGSSITVTKKMMNTSVSTRARGYRRMYPP